jgi:hypothetical protein
MSPDVLLCGVKSTGQVMVEILVKLYPKSSGTFTLYAYASNTVALQHRKEVLEIFAEANFGDNPLKTELNPSTGVVRCGFSSYLTPDIVSSDHIAQMEKYAVSMISTQLPMLENYAEDGTSS